MAFHNLDADYNQLIVTTNFFVPCKFTFSCTIATSYFPNDTIDYSL